MDDLHIYESDEVYKFLIKKLKNPSAQRSFLNEKFTDAAKWSKETREWVKTLMLYSPVEVPLNPVYLEEVDFGSYVRKKLYFYSAEDCKVSAYLLVPKGLKKPAPAIVALHDHSGRYYWGKEKIVDHKEKLPVVDWIQEWRYGNRGFASALAERGYIVIVIDSLGWGERGWLRESWLRNGAEELNGLEKGSEEYILAYDKIWNKNKLKMEDVAFYAGVTYIGMQIWDDIRSVDFLCTLAEVDHERIGCVGLSMGGFRSVCLGALDERIQCSCPVGYMTRTSDIIPHRSPGVGFTLPGLYDHLPYPDFASLMVPRPMLVLNCENDHLFELSSMEKAVETIAMVYKKAGAEGMFESKGFPVGHQFDLEMQEYAFAWFDRHFSPLG